MSSNKHSVIEMGRSVIAIEAKGLLALEASLGPAFEAAVSVILKAEGHLIVVGIGKSGHVGRKIAASFASTGTPSFFLHPSEAAHGDLGMITPDDVVLALSHSGESVDVSGVVDYALALGNKVVAITGSAKSTLAEKATIALVLPDMAEACPNNLAPTTSTTATMAMGDALCVAVMTLKRFSAEDFGHRHPAGKLGFGLKRVSQYLDNITNFVPSVEENAEMAEVIVAMTSGGKGCVAVLNGGHLSGIVTDGDLRRAMSPDIMTLTAADIMSISPFTVSPDMRIKDVVAAMTERKIGNAFVVKERDLLGLIDLKTLLATGYV